MRILIAALIIVLTIVIHAIAMSGAITLSKIKIKTWKNSMKLRRIASVSGVVLIMFLASIVEVVIWAGAYMGVNAIEGFERAFYFSIVTYTTLGYGDIVLSEHWRTLAGFEAANGIIMFGWTTAMVIAVVQHNYFKSDSGDE